MSVVDGRPEYRRRQIIIAQWLLFMCLMVFAMVILGGVTRLTGSGLSIVEWKPLTGWWPPTTEAHWMELFEKYKQFPEYQKLNKGMDLDGFKGIFWLEFLHRVWGRLIGLAFFVPMVFFVVRGWVDRPLGLKLVVMFVLGGLQGLMGWYMVKSGLIDMPNVSQYRLTAHFGLALVIMVYMLWVALDLMAPRPHQVPERHSRGLRKFALVVCGWVFLTALSGGFVAGLDAGLTYNTFPLMDGSFVPAGAYVHDPWWHAPFEDITTVQFNHRLLAEALFVLVLVLWWRSRGHYLAGRSRVAINALAAMILVQVTLGISTLLLVVPLTLAALHQAGAVVLLMLSVWIVHELRESR